MVEQMATKDQQKTHFTLQRLGCDNRNKAYGIFCTPQEEAAASTSHCLSSETTAGRKHYIPLNSVTLFQYLFHPCVTAAACKKSWSFCQKCRWMVTAKHLCTLRMWLCVKWGDMAHGCTAYTESAELAAVSSGTSHVTTKQLCNYVTWVDIQSTM